MNVEKKGFPCERCGICCRNIGNAPFAKDMVLPNGICKHLDEETNLCRIYSTRPVFCNVDSFYDKYLSQKMTREEFYRQNKQACRKFQRRETSFDTTELEEWVLPSIRDLNNGQDSGLSDKLKALDNELTLDKMSKKERKIYEDNGIVPFKRTTSSSSSALPPIIFKQMKDQQWASFEAAAENPSDYPTALQHLDNYVDLIPSNERAEFCYGLFVEFSHERNKTKGDFFAEKILEKISDTRDVEKLLDIVSYFEQKRDIAKAEPFYFTLYEVYHHGEGTEKNLDKAINFLKASILGNNTDEKRVALRELYEEKNFALDEKNRARKAFEMVIADNIQFAKTDYAIYLRGREEYTEAIHWFVADGKFAEAYEIVNIKLKEKIDSTVAEFVDAGAADSEFFKALKLMQSKFQTLQDLFAFDKPEKTPLTYVGISLMYTFFGFFYAIFRTAKRSLLALAIGLLITGAVFFGGWKIGHLGLGAAAIAIWTFVLIYLDVQRRKKFVAACALRLKLPSHPNLEECSAVFKDSEKIVNQSKKSWALIFPVLATLFSAVMTLATFEMPPEKQKQIISQMATEQKNSEPSPQVENQNTNKEIADTPEPSKSTLDERNKPNSSNLSPKVEDSSKPRNASVMEQKTDPPKEKPKPAASSNLLLTQTDVGKVFGNYYLAVSEKRYKDAYSYLTPACQNRLGSPESFAQGRKDTLSIEILDFQQTAASGDTMSATYKILTRDKIPGGVKVQIFDGQTVLTKVDNKWFIDYLSSKLVSTHNE